jgi:hypothetical protein
MDFIRYNLISKILTKYRQDKSLYQHDGFFYFKNKVSKINRIGKGFLYFEEEVLPIDWKSIKGKDLVQVYNLYKDNDIFFYKEIDGKFYKTRPKKKDAKEKLLRTTI